MFHMGSRASARGIRLEVRHVDGVFGGEGGIPCLLLSSSGDHTAVYKF